MKINEHPTRGKTINIFLYYVLPVDLHDVAVCCWSASVPFLALLLFLVSKCACLTDLTHLPRSFQLWLLVLGCSCLHRDGGQRTRKGRKREGGGTWRLRNLRKSFFGFYGLLATRFSVHMAYFLTRSTALHSP